MPTGKSLQTNCHRVVFVVHASYNRNYNNNTLVAPGGTHDDERLTKKSVRDLKLLQPSHLCIELLRFVDGVKDHQPGPQRKSWILLHLDQV